ARPNEHGWLDDRNPARGWSTSLAAETSRAPGKSRRSLNRDALRNSYQDITLLGQQLQCPRRDFFRVPEPAQSFIPAGEHSFLRANEFHTAGLEHRHVLAGGRVEPHFAVHGR